MSENVWQELKQKYKFCHVGDLNIKDDGCLKYSCNENAGNRPSVYVVVASKDDAESVWYVGLASNGWKYRHRQHNAGLKRVFSGKHQKEDHRKLFDVRIEMLNDGNKVRVYEKISISVNVFETVVPIHHAEELALIKLLKPKDNKLR